LIVIGRFAYCLRFSVGHDPYSYRDSEQKRGTRKREADFNTRMIDAFGSTNRFNFFLFVLYKI